MSLDGFIADANGGYDWIIHDRTLDFGAIWKQFDAAVMGRKTFETVLQRSPTGAMPGMHVVVFSGTLRAEDYPAVTILAGDPAQTVASLKDQPGKDIWLYGGGALFRTRLDAGQVDAIEIGVVPVLLGSGIPLVPPGRHSGPWRLDKCDTLPSGIVMLSYFGLQ